MTIDDTAVEIFKIYDELTQKYIKEIDGYRALIQTIDTMIDQKESNIREIKNNILALLKQTIDSTDRAIIQEEKIYNYAGVEVEDMEPQITQPESPPVAELEMLEPDIIQPETPTATKTRSRKQQKETVTRKGKDRSKALATGITESEIKAPGSKKTEKPVQDKNNLNCLYHPESPVVDMQRQLCSSCRWKLRTNGLTGHDKYPEVISFLKGETNIIPDVGQLMCPIHPDRPAYSKKTGLCINCQRKAKVIGVTD